MKRGPTIKLKAIFLLIVFIFNTVVGFACSIGIDLKFNSSQHSEDKAFHFPHHKETHQPGEKAMSSHKHDRSHSHDQAMADQHQAEKSKDDCCSDDVMNFAQVDKRSPQSQEFNFQPLLIALLFTSANHFSVPALNRLESPSKYYVRSYHPPIPKIRIAIQSFQI